mgnify:CR=1 FL=1
MDHFAFIEDHLADQEEGMKNLITGVLNPVMLAGALQQAGAAQYERTDARKAHRNSYKERSLKTRYGDLILRDVGRTGTLKPDETIPARFGSCCRRTPLLRGSSTRSR